MSGYGNVFNLLIYFCINANEVYRIDSEMARDRFRGPLEYVLEKGYIKHKQFLRWRREKFQQKQHKK